MTRSLTFRTQHAITEAAISPGAKATAQALLRYMDARTGLCWPSVKTLAQHVGRSLPSIYRYLREIFAAGIFEPAKHLGRTAYRAIVGITGFITSDKESAPYPYKRTDQEKEGTEMEKKSESAHPANPPFPDLPDQPPKHLQAPERQQPWWPPTHDREPVPNDQRADFDALRMHLQAKGVTSASKDLLLYLRAWFTRAELASAVKAAVESGRAASKRHFALCDHLTDNFEVTKQRCHYTVEEQRAKGWVRDEYIPPMFDLDEAPPPPKDPRKDPGWANQVAALMARWGVSR